MPRDALNTVNCTPVTQRKAWLFLEKKRKKKKREMNAQKTQRENGTCVSDDS